MGFLEAIDWHQFFFVFFSVLTCVFAIAVLFSSNIVRMAFYLVLSLGASSGLFFLAGSEFVGAMQLMIYVGGTLVLLIFGVMLTGQSRFISMKTGAGDWVVAAAVGGSLLLLLIGCAFSVEDWRTPLSPEDQAELTIADSKTAAPIGLALVGARIDKLDQPADSPLVGGMSGYLLPFVIISVHLLVVLIGAAYMARTRVSSEKAVAD